MTNLPQIPGIYKIICTINRKYYVGSTIDLNRRWVDHRRALRKGRHDNPHLQNAWNKYGESAFMIEILEYVMPWALIDREQYWLDKLKPYNPKIGFNIALKAQASMRGRTQSLEARKKLSNYRMGKPLSPEIRAKMSVTRRGMKSLPETRIKQSLAKSMKWVVISPDGDEIHIHNLRAFCKQNDLNNAHMVAVALGKRPSHKGWKCRHDE